MALRELKKTIARQYIHILGIIIGVLSIVYAILFVINRIQYIDDRIILEEREIFESVTRTANIAAALNLKQVRYFIDYAKLLEFFYNNHEHTIDGFLKQNSVYDFIGITNKNGKFLYTSSPKFSRIFRFTPHSSTSTIKNTIAYSDKMHTAHQILSYPMRGGYNKQIIGYIVAYVDINLVINMRGIYMVRYDSFVMNDNYVNDIYMGNKNIAFLYPEAWARMQLEESGQFISNNILFTYKSITPDVTIKNARVETNRTYFLSMKPINPADSPYHINSIKSFIKYVDFGDRIFYWILGYAFIIFTSVVSYIVIVGRIKSNLLSNTCQLTGAYNRRKGFILMEKIIKDYNVASKFLFMRLLKFSKLPTSLHICLIDIDNLKTTNDKLGHKYGDELIATSIHSIRRHLKRGDIITRIGGDEFVIVFVNRAMEDIEKIWQQVREDFERKNKSGKYRYVIRVSKGTIEYQKGMDLESALIEADKLMYQEKRGHKVNLFFD